ncbi:hypothetical protein BDR03DRAFT_971363 [Suillus americanus]|nr:hypothetical protein BDR03DRAFT_971363 [Suillus americanus]
MLVPVILENCTEEVEEGSLLDASMSALIEVEKDGEFQENVVRFLYTFATSCNGAFSAVQKHSLRDSWE